MQINILGNEIRKVRKLKGESLADAAKHIGVDRTHLNKIELGSYKPSDDLLNRIIAHFSVGGSKANQLKALLKNSQQVEKVIVGEENNERRNKSMAKKGLESTSKKVMINPEQTPVLYTDAVFVHSSDYGLVLDVAQNTTGDQQTVVTRIGMSFDHAKKLVEVIHDQLEKNER